MTKKIGIITWHYYSNFGSALQTFASYYTLKYLGFDPIVVNYRNRRLYPEKLPLKNKIKYIVKSFLTNIPFVPLKYKYNDELFRNRYIKETKIFFDEQPGSEICKGLDAVMCGSDQIWAPNVYNPFYFAHYLDGRKIRKISYAASIGLNDIPDNLIDIYKTHLSDFYAISVREQEGSKLLKKRCGINSTVVLDPTLLVDSSIYKMMQKRVPGLHRPYLFCYFLNGNHNYKEKVEEYAKLHNLEIVGVSDRSSDSTWMKKMSNLGADHFLWLINNASAVMTDSYHGSIFSLLFHKKIWIFVRFSEDNPICQNSRIRQLVDNFNIGHRVLLSHSLPNESNLIDYDLFESKLSELRLSSLSYLKNALM